MENIDDLLIEKETIETRLGSLYKIDIELNKLYLPDEYDVRESLYLLDLEKSKLESRLNVVNSGIFRFQNLCSHTPLYFGSDGISVLSICKICSKHSVEKRI